MPLKLAGDICGGPIFSPRHLCGGIDVTVAVAEYYARLPLRTLCTQRKQGTYASQGITQRNTHYTAYN